MRSMELCMRAVVTTDNIRRIGSGSTVIMSLCKERSMDEAFQAVQIMEQQGYACHGLVFPALELFEEMQQQRIKPERATFLSILKACGTIGLIDCGRLTHEQIMAAGLDLDVIVGSALIDMYTSGVEH